MVGLGGGMGCEYFEYLNTSLASLDIHSQRAASLMADHDDIVAELGATSDQAKLARELYAAAVFAGARDGVMLPALEPLTRAIGPSGAPRLEGEKPLYTEPASIDRMFDAEFSGCLFVEEEDTLGVDKVCAAKKRSAPNIFTERQMLGPRWDDPKRIEIGKIDRLGAKTPILADDPMIKDMKPVDTMWAGRSKLNPDGSVERDAARCVLRGDIHSKVYQVDANQRMSPVVRNSSMMCVDAVSAMRRQHMQPFDVTGAYLHGKQTESEQVLARPPVGFREYDERGVEILWLMWVPLYGQTDAGAIWNRTINDFQTSSEMGYERCPSDPCVYSKSTSDGSRCTMPLYVDDGRYYWDSTVEGIAESKASRKRFAEAFEVKYGDEDPVQDWFLSSNRVSPALGACSVRCTSYIDQMVKRYAGGDVTPSKRFPMAWGYTPADDTLTREFEAASATRTPATPELSHRYMSLCTGPRSALHFSRRGARCPFRPRGCMIASCVYSFTWDAPAI